MRFSRSSSAKKGSSVRSQILMDLSADPVTTMSPNADTAKHQTCTKIASFRSGTEDPHTTLSFLPLSFYMVSHDGTPIVSGESFAKWPMKAAHSFLLQVVLLCW